MATLTSLSLSLSHLQNPLHFPPSSSLKTLLLQRPKSFRSFTIRATESEPSPSDSSDQSKSETESESSTPASDDDFDTRMNEFRLRYRSGIGKKAEMRKVKKSRKGASSASGSGSAVYLPPVPLKEPVSSGLKVELGFSSYSERLNGRIAILGLTALLLVELATRKGVINYHTPAIVLIQIYFVAAVAALYVKYEKEKISVWPQSSRNE